MAATWKAVGGEITLNGTTPVTLAGPPPAGKTQVVIGLSGVPDASYTLTLRKNKGGTLTNIQIVSGIVSGGKWPAIEPVALDATDETLEAVLNTAGTPKMDVASVQEV